jgi:hypothetical protein
MRSIRLMIGEQARRLLTKCCRANAFYVAGLVGRHGGASGYVSGSWEGAGDGLPAVFAIEAVPASDAQTTAFWPGPEAGPKLKLENSGATAATLHRREGPNRGLA